MATLPANAQKYLNYSDKERKALELAMLESVSSSTQATNVTLTETNQLLERYLGDLDEILRQLTTGNGVPDKD